MVWRVNRFRATIESDSAGLWFGAAGRPGWSAMRDGWPSGAVPQSPYAASVSASRILAASTRSPAGRFFVPPPEDPDSLPTAPSSFFVVHITLSDRGFRVNDRPVPPRMLAQVIRMCPEWRHRSVVVVPVGVPGPESGAGALFIAMAAALDVPVLSSASDIRVHDGRLTVEGVFDRWLPPRRRGADIPASTGLGPELPVPGNRRRTVPVVAPGPPLPDAAAAVMVASAPAARTAPATATTRTVPAAATPSMVPLSRALVSSSSTFSVPAAVAASLLPADEAFPAAVTVRSPASSSSVPTGSIAVGAGPETTTVRDVAIPAAGKALWIEVHPRAGRDDREHLRETLGWQYEAHERAVTGMLALQPSLRAGPGADDLLAGLVAVRAHLSSTGGAVDVILRGETDYAANLPAVSSHLDEEAVRLLARCATSGLHRLPSVVGPVYRPGSPSGPVREIYRSGHRLIEPSFVEARPTRYVPGGSTVEYAIWSSTGRRTDGVLGPGAVSGGVGSRVIFAAGSQFLVLAVDDPGPVGGPLRVLLREVQATAAAGAVSDELTRQRLRENMAVAPIAESLPLDQIALQWSLPLGVRRDATPFALPAPTGGLSASAQARRQ